MYEGLHIDARLSKREEKDKAKILFWRRISLAFAECLADLTHGFVYVGGDRART